MNLPNKGWRSLAYSKNGEPLSDARYYPLPLMTFAQSLLPNLPLVLTEDYSLEVTLPHRDTIANTSCVYAVSHDLDALKHRTALWAYCISLSTLGFVLFLKPRSHYASPYGVTWHTTLHPQTRTLPFIAFSTHSALIQSRRRYHCCQCFLRLTCFATLSLLARTSLLPLFSSHCCQI